MTPEEIIAKRKKLQENIAELQNQIEHVRLDLQRLTLYCDHAEEARYTDVTGSFCSTCPTCGRAT